MLFDPRKAYKFRHIQNSGLVRDRDDLKKKVDNFGFPAGRLLTPRDRQWTGEELNTYYESRPVTQKQFDALPNRAPKSKPQIIRKQKLSANETPRP
jgi:hypothetical protein